MRGVNAPLARSAHEARSQELLPLLGALAALALSAAEEVRELRISVPLGVLDVRVEPQHVPQALLDEPDDVVVLVLGAGDLPGLLGRRVGHFSPPSSSSVP